MPFIETEIFKHNDAFQGFDLEKFLVNKGIKKDFEVENFIVFDDEKISENNYLVKRKNVIYINSKKEDLKIIFNPSSFSKTSFVFKISDSSLNFYIYLIDLIEEKSFQEINLDFYFRNSSVNFFLISVSNDNRVRFANIKNFLVRNSNVNFDFSLFDSFLKFRIENYLDTNTSINLNGIAVCKNNDLLDFYGLLKHIKRNSVAKISFRNIVSEKAKSVVKGLIDISKVAKNSESYISLHSFIASKDANSQVLPMLAIENNEVKATHSGSSIAFDEEKLFYLMSRGLDENQAKSLIIEGFLNYSIMLMKDRKFISKVKYILQKKFQNEKIKIEDLLREIEEREILKIAEYQEFFERHYKYR